MTKSQITNNIQYQNTNDQNGYCGFGHLTLSIVCDLVLVICLFAPIFLPTFSYAAKSDYELLVGRNLELREKVETLEQKYAQLENERNVLIGHVRNLQQEKERLVNAPGGPSVDESRYARIETVVKEVSDKLSVVTEEKAGLEKELAKTKEMLEEGQAKAETLEQENSALNKELKNIKEELAARPVGSLRGEKAAENRMMVGEEQPPTELADSKKMLEVSRLEVKTLRSEKDVLAERIEEVQKKLKKSQVAQKDTAIERAFLRAQEAELKARDRSLLSESDQLKADVQKSTRVNAALKDTERKLQQAKQDLDAARVGSRKVEAKNRKLESKLAGMNGLKARARKNEEELQALRMLQQEHEAMIRKLTAEKSALEARLAKLEAPAGVSRAARARQKGVLSPANKQKLDMHFNLAVAYDKTKMYKAEEREYMECLRLDPRDANVHYNLGILYDDKLKDDAKAIKHYQRYLQLRPMGEDSEQVKEWIMHAEQRQRL